MVDELRFAEAHGLVEADTEGYRAVEVSPSPEVAVEGIELAALARSWIEVELLDEDDLPVAGARFEIRLPDGSLRTGRLGPDGRASVEGIAPGNCGVTFPELESSTWEEV